MYDIHNFDEFDGFNPWAFLSNFFVGDPIQVEDITFMTGEHIFQGYKTTNDEWFNKILEAPTPGEAKRLGRNAPLRHDWEGVKYDVMRLTVVSKFAPGRQEAEWLLATGDALLTEGTRWGDTTWGVKIGKATGLPASWEGRNWLGTLLMARRAELRAFRAGAFLPRVTEIARYASTVPPEGPKKAIVARHKDGTPLTPDEVVDQYRNPKPYVWPGGNGDSPLFAENWLDEDLGAAAALDDREINAMTEREWEAYMLRLDNATQAAQSSAKSGRQRRRSGRR